MRYIIYGAGAIGGVVGGFLSLAGKDVVFIGRPGQVKAINENGLQLITLAGNRTIRVPAVSKPSEITFKPDDVVFLTVKSQDTDEALLDLHKVVKDTPVFCVQNGVRNEEVAAKYFKRVYGVRVRIGALYTKEGEITAKSDPPGGLVLGKYPTGKDTLLESIAADLRQAGFWALVAADIMPYKWGQLIGNLANAPSAITSATEDEGRKVINAVRQEAAEILKQAGIRWVPEDDLSKEVPQSGIIKDTLGGRHQNSTWQSLMRKTGVVESDYFNGEIVRLAKKIGKQAPINEKVLSIVKEMAAKREQPGKYTAAQLAKLLGVA